MELCKIYMKQMNSVFRRGSHPQDMQIFHHGYAAIPKSEKSSNPKHIWSLAFWKREIQLVLHSSFIYLF